MNVDELILVSVDDHMVEPPDMFEGRVPDKYKDQVPRLVRREDETMAWVYEGQQVPNIALNAVAGRPREELGAEPTTFEELRPGCYDIHARVKDMDAAGVLGSMCFPSFPRFCGQLFLAGADKDPEQAQSMVRAYNDWHIEAWAGAYPGRFIPMAMPMLWDPVATADEVRRVAGKGCYSLTFSANPFDLGLPSLYSDHWDPLWQACVDEGVIVSMHIGSNSKPIELPPEAPIEVVYTLTPISLFQSAADLVWSPLFQKFPDLKVAFSEGGIGWVPYFLERVDWIYQSHTKYWTGTDMGGRLPSQVFNDHVVLCYIEDNFGLDSRKYMNLDNIAWECDYPHADSSWPYSAEDVIKHADGLSRDELDKITHLNAMRHFRYDPFSVIRREEATVGALRARAAGWDVSPQAGAVRRAKAADGGWQASLSSAIDPGRAAARD
jgi:predicted TIM-barrel fold metal-dependent hydrolase